MTDWDDAYANMAHVPGSEALPGRWAAEASAYRSSGVRIEEDVAYGDGPRQKLDLVWPDGAPRGLAVFVHGGYWMRLAKSDWTHLAEGARAAGWAVALPGYTLTPAARIAEITREVRAAILCAAEKVSGPIRLAGHSAGGHLVTRMACADLDLPVAGRVDHVLSISGVHDLRPLLRTSMNSTLQLDLAEAQAESPALLVPRTGANVTAWVGGAERPEFIRQTLILDQMWQGFDVEVASHVDPSHNHFSVIDALTSPESALTRTFVGA